MIRFWAIEHNANWSVKWSIMVKSQIKHFKHWVCHQLFMSRAAAKTYFDSYSCYDNGTFKPTQMLPWQQNLKYNLEFYNSYYIFMHKRTFPYIWILDVLWALKNIFVFIYKVMSLYSNIKDLPLPILCHCSRPLVQNWYRIEVTSTAGGLVFSCLWYRLFGGCFQFHVTYPSLWLW